MDLKRNPDFPPVVDQQVTECKSENEKNPKLAYKKTVCGRFCIFSHISLGSFLTQEETSLHADALSDIDFMQLSICVQCQRSGSAHSTLKLAGIHFCQGENSFAQGHFSRVDACQCTV